MNENSYKLLKLYIRSLSVESPSTGRLPPQIQQPNIDIDIDPMITRVADDMYEVAARFTISARSNGVHLYVIEMIQAGLFSLASSAEADREVLLRRVLPQLIFPAARNNLVSFIVAAGYQPIVLDHIRLESLFARTEVKDKRSPLPAPTPQAMQHAAPEQGARQAASGRRLRPAALTGGGAIVLMLLATQVDWSHFGGEAAAPQAEKQMPAAAQIIAASQPQPSVPAVAQNEVSGLPITLLEQTGSDWFAAQDKGAYTVELLRTNDLKSVENVAPIEQGLPLFLLKVQVQGGAGYAVLSGTYGSREQAVQAAAKSAAYRAVRFGEYGK